MVKFVENFVALFQHVLTTTYFKWDNPFYEQLDGVAIGNSVSPVIENYISFVSITIFVPIFFISTRNSGGFIIFIQAPSPHLKHILVVIKKETKSNYNHKNCVVLFSSSFELGTYRRIFKIR